MFVKASVVGKEGIFPWFTGVLFVHCCRDLQCMHVPNDITGTRLLMGRRVEMEILTDANPKPKGIWQETALVCKNR